MKRIARSAILAHSAEAIYALVEDIESYPRFLPWCRSARVERSGSSMTRATVEVGMRGLAHAFTTQNTNQPGRAIDMKLVEGPFRHFTAGWRFQPLAPDACRVEFSMDYAFSSDAFGRLLGPLFEGIANSMVDAFSRRADSLEGKGPPEDEG